MQQQISTRKPAKLVRVPPDLWEALAILAHEDHRSVNAFIVLKLQEYVEYFYSDDAEGNEEEI
jgi:hypothetical protein